MSKAIIISFLLLTLSGCGGGGSDSEPTPTVTLASVNAGADRVQTEEETVTLEAVADPVGGVFTWRQTTGPVLEGFPFTGPTTTFVAPSVKSDTQFSFLVEYQPTEGQMISDAVTVTITPLNRQPVAVISIDTHTSNSVTSGETVTLNGANSRDVDTDGQIVSYAWKQTGGDESVIILGNTTDATFSFLAPVELTNSPYQFELTVTDDEGASSTNTINLNVVPSAAMIVAHAGADQTVSEFSSVTLDGSKSQASGSFNCEWTQTQGVPVVINDRQACTANFSTPNIDGTETMTFQVTVTDTVNNTHSDSVVITINHVPLGNINDTGLRKCYDANQEVSCDDALFSGQDGHTGRDFFFDKIDKVGQGNSGFDYSKLDKNGKEIADNSSDFACIRDNLTGLIWEVKQPSENSNTTSQTRAANNLYTWSYEGDSGGVPGTLVNPLTTCPNTTDCGAETFVKEVNAGSYCGASNWRLPNVEELRGLIDYSILGSDNLLDSLLFPNTPNQAAVGHLYYWTLQTNADGTANNGAWVVDFNSGDDTTILKADTAYIRLVRKPGEGVE